MDRTTTLAIAAVIATFTAALGDAYSASPAGTPGAPSPAGSSAAGGTAGSAAAGGTAASTLGLGATTTGSTGTQSGIGTGGSAAGGTRDTTSSKIHGSAGNLHGMAKARAQNGGDWSRSMTKTRVHQGEVFSSTRSMSHEPGGPPSKSTSTIDTSGLR